MRALSAVQPITLRHPVTRFSGMCPGEVGFSGELRALIQLNGYTPGPIWMLVCISSGENRAHDEKAE